MKPVLLIAFILNLSLSYGQSTKYRFSIHSDALVQINDAERDTLLPRLDGFLKYKNGSVQDNPYVDSAYAKVDVNPFEMMFNVESNREDLNFYKPTLLAILPAIKDQQYIMKLSYMGVTPQNEPVQRMIVTLVAEKRRNNYYFFNAVNYSTRNWNKKQVGSVKYIYPYQLNLAKAREMDRMNKIIAKKFAMPIIPLTYYRCDDPEQMLKIMGYDYVSNMYWSMAGGFAPYWISTVFAGNNSELYVHELVHFYTLKLFPVNTRIMNEGYATYLGGSGGGLSLDESKPLARNYLDKHPDKDITQVFINFDRVEKSIPFTYIVSGLICRDVETKYGFEKIKRLFEAKSDDEYFKLLEEVTGVTKKQFSDYVRKLVN
nr:hypothetical protein [uncultured Mucilaginibacter sp.]